MTTLLMDFNNLLSRIFFIGPVNAKSENPDFHRMRFVAIDSIYRSMLKMKCNEVILAVDSSPSWRKEIWPRYKESRKGKRDKLDTIDWNVYFLEFHRLLNDVAEFLPFKVIKVNNAEADDIIGIIALNINKSFVIISTDKDYLQLSSKRIKIYNPLKKKFVEESNPEEFLIKQCLMGQSKDDIFNVLTPLDFNGKRKPGIGEEKVEKIIRNGYENWLLSENAVDHFELNKKLIDFNLIPENIKENIIKKYKEYRLPRLDHAYDFFKQNNFLPFLEDYHRVENTLSRLYE